MLLENDVKLDFQDVLIRPKRSTISSRHEVLLTRDFKTKYGNYFSGVPIIVANMSTGTFSMLESVSQECIFVAIAKHHSKEWKDNIKYLTRGFYTIGTKEEELKDLISFANKVSQKDSVKICIDIANGYSQNFSKFVSHTRELFPTNVIIAGNVCTPEMVQELVIAGADFVKVGIGPGSQCLTRYQTGVGYPQLSAIIECSDAAHGLGAGIVADGGCKCPGDVAKAFVANSDLVMLGGMFSGTDEQDGNIIEKKFRTSEIDPEEGSLIIEKKYFKTFYGMSSEYAQDLHGTGMKDYRTSEGRVEEVPYKGSAITVCKDILGGLRSCGSYIGAASIKNFGKCGTFIRVNRQHDRF